LSEVPERLAADKRSSLFGHSVNDKEKHFKPLTPGWNFATGVGTKAQVSQTRQAGWPLGRLHLQPMRGQVRLPEKAQELLRKEQPGDNIEKPFYSLSQWKSNL